MNLKLKNPFQDKIELFLVSGIFVFAFILRAWGYEFGLPILYNGDEGQVIQRAIRFGSGDLNPHNFIYPSLYMYLLFFAYGAYFLIGSLFGTFSSLAEFKGAYFIDPSMFYIIGRLLSAAAGALTIVFVYLIGKRAYNRATGVVAALFLSVEYLHVRFSHLAKPDTMMACLAVIALYYAYKIYEEGQWTDYLLSGAFTGLAISAKYNANFVVLAILSAHVLRTYQGRFANLKNDFKLLFMSFASVGIFFIIGSPFALLDAKTFLHDLQFQSLAITQQQSFVDFLLTILKYCREMFLPSDWGLSSEVFGFFILLGLGFFLIRPEKKDFVFLPLLIVHFLFFTYKTSSSFLKPHYLLPILALFYLLGAKAFVMLIHKIKVSPARQSALVYAASALLVFSPLKDVISSNYERTLPDTGNLARQWVETNLPADSKILFAGAHHLGLKENRESLIANRASDTRRASEEKLKALLSYSGKRYCVSYLYHGWAFMTDDKTELVDHVPSGVQLVDKQKLSLNYWKNADYQYVIVFGAQDEKGYPDEAKYPHFRAFFDELFAQATMIEEFLPVASSQSGLPVRIYRLADGKAGS